MAKILIIDDEKMIRERLSQLLSLDGFDIATAESGADGLRLFEEQEPDISLVDIKMPGMSGIDVLKAINARGENTEVIMITGHGGNDTVIQALNEGAFGYVQKPIEYEELLIIINKALEKIMMRRQLQEHVIHLEKAIEEKSQELALRIQAERALQENIEQAKEYQKKLVTITSPRIYNMRFYTDYIPFTKVGGDILNIIKVENRVWFYLADIAGHGVVAAILATFLKAHLDRWIRFTIVRSPLEIINRLKELINEQTIFKENLLAIFIGCLHTDTLLLSYINAGQFKPLVATTDPATGLEVYQELPGTSCPLSEIFKEYKYEMKNFPLENPAKLLVFSDGLIERINNQGEIVSTRGLLQYCQVNGLSQASLQAFVHHHNLQAQNDDISYILLDINSVFTKDYRCNLCQTAEPMQDIQEELLARYPEGPATSRVLQSYYELLTNAIEHGHKNDETKITRIKFLYGKENLIISIRDEGAGFKWQTQLQQKPSPAMKRGRGLYLVKNLCQSLVFNEQGNEITIEISFPPNNNI